MRQSRLTDYWALRRVVRRPTKWEPPTIHLLPAEVLAACFSFVPISDLVAAHNVCHAWRYRINGLQLWRSAFLREADYEHADLRRVRHLETMADDFEEALERARERGYEQRREEHDQCDLHEDDSDSICSGWFESPPSPEWSDYYPEVDGDEVTTEWRRLCLIHLKRSVVRSEGHINVRWAFETLDPDMVLCGIDSVENKIYVVQAPNGTLPPAERELLLVILDRQTLKTVTMADLPPAVCYRMEKDMNVDSILHRFRRTEATAQSPAIEWVEVWVPYHYCSKMKALPKEVGAIPPGTLRTSELVDYVPGFAPIAAINIDEARGGTSTVHAFSTRPSPTEDTLKLWIRIGAKTLLLCGEPQEVSPRTVTICRFAQRGSKIEITPQGGGRLLFTFPQDATAGPPVAVLYRFELSSVVNAGYQELDLDSGTLKMMGKSVNPLRYYQSTAYQYLAKAFVSGDKDFDKTINTTTGIKSWDVQSFKYLEEADCLIVFLADDHLLLIPAWTNVYTQQQQLDPSQRDRYFRDQSVLLQLELGLKSRAGHDRRRIGFRGAFLHIYSWYATLIINCSTIVTSPQTTGPGVETASQT
ncbi:hypothetical protein Q8F55_008510 [Vanrija albida]|uniref:F-box domain-containing protein n=1 Tax=Vanrija albida TaxID=181172 RepID=A0ABR3PR61_9TREE